MHRRKQVGDTSRSADFRSGLPAHCKGHQKNFPSRDISSQLATLDLDSDFKLLGLQSPTMDPEIVKKAFKKQCLLYHPDKNPNGDKEFFDMISDAYRIIMREIAARRLDGDHSMKPHDSLKRDFEDIPVQDTQNKFVDHRDFDINLFNKVYTDYRIEDPVSVGYTDDQNDEWEEPSIKTNISRNSHGRDSHLNSAFQMSKKQAHEKNKALIQVNDPQPLLSTNLCYAELGEERPEDFGWSNNVGGSQYSDYLRAYGRDSKLIYVDDDQYTDKPVVMPPKNRENIGYDPIKDQQFLRQHEAAGREDMLQRKARVQERDRVAFEAFAKMNHRMLH